MGIKHVLLAGCLAAGLTSPALAQGCVRPAERSAVDLRAVQSQLMVAAIACGRSEDYNQFVRRHQTELGAAHRTVFGVFRRAHGAQAQRQYDALASPTWPTPSRRKASARDRISAAMSARCSKRRWRRRTAAPSPPSPANTAS